LVIEQNLAFRGQILL